ncbi:MAG TPA: sulfite exporter TauE/SafE family protein [Xanthobacteraceae bacterium]|nr:sulfite exporter TauE/SafE family protein [Xanthobacteraceae bacterium]
MVDLLSLDVVIFLTGTLAAAFVTGLAGFAFGMVAASIWLYALTPLQASLLIVAYGILVQGYAVWKLRHSVNMYRLAPFIVGSAAGIPAGVAALRWTASVQLRAGVGALLIAFSLYNLVRPRLPEMKGVGRSADLAVGFLNGVLGGATGLAGILPTIWTSLRGWSGDEQRAVFQPTAVATFLMTILALGGVGAITPDTVHLFLIGIPALVFGSALGWCLYGKLDEATFRRIVLGLLLVSGTALLASGR